MQPRARPANLHAPRPVDTRAMFRPVTAALITLLRTLSAADWERQTVAGAWVVRDIVAHLLDTALRRLSFHRDGMRPPPPDAPIASDRDFVGFINRLNAQWVGSTKRLSPRVLTDLYERASGELADWFESLPLEAPALFPVSWAGEEHSAGWFDIGREFTEVWHHQEQVRMAVGADSLSDPRYLEAVIDLAVRGLPHAFRDVKAEPGETVVVDISGPSGGQWTLARETDQWSLWAGQAPNPTTSVRLSDETAWKVLFNALPSADANRFTQIEGRTDLAQPLLRARSIVI
jgi:uncharacterized protein (TIGR03083 family)